MEKHKKNTFMLLISALCLCSALCAADLSCTFGASGNVFLSPGGGHAVQGPAFSIESSFPMEWFDIVAEAAATASGKDAVTDISLFVRKTAPLDIGFSLFLETGPGLRVEPDRDIALSVLCRGGLKLSLTEELELLAYAGLRSWPDNSVGVDAGLGGSWRFGKF